MVTGPNVGGTYPKVGGDCKLGAPVLESAEEPGRLLLSPRLSFV